MMEPLKTVHYCFTCQSLVANPEFPDCDCFFNEVTPNVQECVLLPIER